jgi:hypothetical protein
LETARTRRTYVAFALVVLLVSAGVGAISLYYQRGGNELTTETNSSGGSSIASASTTTSSTVKLPSYWSSQPYLNASEAYASLGYPLVYYDYYTTLYQPSLPNFTMFYRAQDFGNIEVGVVESPVISLDRAVGPAAVYAGLDPFNYTLGEATFVPGDVFNGTMVGHPAWFLYFAQIHDGYWIEGNEADAAGSLSIEVTVDALNGTVLHMQGNKLILPNTGQFDLRVNASAALRTVRESNMTGIPAELTKDGTVDFMEPRVVIPHEYPSTGWFDSSLPGHSVLVWIVSMSYPTSASTTERGTFIVDAQTGALIAGDSGENLGGFTFGERYSGSVVNSTATNLIFSNETFTVNGSLIGKQGSVQVVAPSVLVVRPGSAGSVELNFTVIAPKVPPNLTLSLVNPIPGYQNLSFNGSPPGTSLQFSRPALTLVGNGSVYPTLLVSVSSKAPPGTYLIEADGTFGSSPRIKVLFFLSVWDGVGAWPAPPMVK